MKLENWDSIWIVLVIISVIALVLPAYIRKRTLNVWRKRLKLDKHEPIFNQLYGQVNGFEASKLARLDHDDFALTYGEIQFQSFIALLSLCRPDKTTIFYDLGSGTGKAVIATAMVYPVKKAIGIECLSSLDEAAGQVLNQLTAMPDYENTKETIQFILDDFLDFDWTDGNLIFINSTTIIGALWTQLLEKLEGLEENTIVITTTKSIPIDSFKLIYCTDVLMSWGIVTAYIHKKMNSTSVSS